MAVPTLVLNATNDPFVPRDSLPGVAEASAHVLLEQPDEGGHVGFLSGPFPGNIDWLPRRLLGRFALLLVLIGPLVRHVCYSVFGWSFLQLYVASTTHLETRSRSSSSN